MQSTANPTAPDTLALVVLVPWPLHLARRFHGHGKQPHICQAWGSASLC